MKYLEEYRDPDVAAGLLREIARDVTRPWVLMEVCGGQTHSIVRYGVDRLLPPEVELVHGPGCPVCVTALETIDRAHAIAGAPRRHLHLVRRHAARPRLARRSAVAARARRRRPRRLRAARRGRRSPARTPTSGSSSSASASRPPRPPTRWRWCRPGASAWPTSPCWSRTCWCRPRSPRSCRRRGNRVQAFLGPGHVCAVVGYREYEALAARYRRPDRHHRLRAGRSAGGDPDGGAPARSGPRRRREPVRAYGHARGERRSRSRRSTRCSR